jgi:hypothetical protein
MNKPYLSYTEQFKEILNNEEIGRIEDYELREIRQKYWNLIHKAFLDEHKIPDSKLGDVLDKYKEAEMEEIEEYRKRKNLT